MKNENLHYLSVVSSLAILVPIPARSAYGIVMIITLNLLVFIGTLMRQATDALHISQMQKPLLIITLISVSLLVYFFLCVYYSLMAVTMHFALFLPVFSSLVIGRLFVPERRRIREALKENMLYSASISAYALVFVLLREIIGRGTLSLPLPGRFGELSFIPAHIISPALFLTTIPGSLVLLALFSAALTIWKRIISRGGSRHAD